MEEKIIELENRIKELEKRISELEKYNLEYISEAITILVGAHEKLF